MNIPPLVWKGLEYSNISVVLDLNIQAASLYWVCPKFSYLLNPGYWVLFKNFHTSMILMYGQRMIFAWHEAGINPVLKLV
jgi:hypothetical protein